MTKEEILKKLIDEHHFKKSELEALPNIDSEEGGYQLKFVDEFNIRLLFQPEVSLVRVEAWGEKECNGGYESDWSVYYHYMAR